MAFLLLIAGGCNTKEDYKIVEFSGAENIINYSRLGNWSQFVADSVAVSAILCSENDLLCNEDVMMVYNSYFPWSSINNLYVDDNVALINESIYAINISPDVDMLPWFESMEQKDLSSLQFININTAPKKEYLTFLKRLAEIKPDAGLYHGFDEENDFSSLYAMFNPRYLIGFNYSSGNRHFLERFTNLELLWVNLVQNDNLEPLPDLPTVKQLFVYFSETEDLPVDFLVHNPQIEKVIIFGDFSGRFDFQALNHLKKLKALTVLDVDSFINPQLINSQSQLESLHLCTCPHPEAINLPHLRWMMFPGEISQEQFDNFIKMHSHLEVVELNNHNIYDLHQLTGLNKLKGLVVIDTLTDLASVQSLSRLEFLSLPQEYIDNATLVAELKEKMPETRIVANEGFCLGSGWLMLLIPLIIVFWIWKITISNSKIHSL